MDMEFDNDNDVVSISKLTKIFLTTCLCEKSGQRL